MTHARAAVTTVFQGLACLGLAAAVAAIDVAAALAGVRRRPPLRT